MNDPILNFHIDELTNLLMVFGDLRVQVSGEGKYNIEQSRNGVKSGMISNIILGDQGCLNPYKKSKTSALLQTQSFLKDLTFTPRRKEYKNKDVDSNSWSNFVDTIYIELSRIKDNHQERGLRSFNFLYNADNSIDVLISVSISLLSNKSVADELVASRNGSVIGEIVNYGTIIDYDKPFVSYVLINIEGKELKIPDEDVVFFRHKNLFQPGKGDYLLFDEKNNKYIILPKEEYCIH